MKVLHVTYWFPSTKQPFYGNFIENHIHAAAAFGGEHHVLYIDVVTDVGFIEVGYNLVKLDNNITLHHYKIACKYWKIPYNFLGLQSFIFKDFQRKRLPSVYGFDLVHSHVIYPAGLLGQKIANHLKIPHIITEHWTEVHVFLKKNIYRRKGYDVYKKASVILPVSKYLGKVIEREGIDSALIKVIPNVVDSDCFYYKPKDNDNRSRHIRFLAIMSLKASKKPHKRPDLAIEALIEFSKQTGTQITLEFVGGGDQMTLLKRKYNDSCISLVFTGHRDKKYIAEALHRADFLIHPTMKETFSIVVAEALKTGTPVIASNVGAIPELIDADSGVLCENTIEDWVMAITAASKYRFDHALIAEKNKNKFNAKDIGNQLYCTYQSIIGSA